MASNMPPGFPTSSDFSPGQISEQTISWDYHRTDEQGGSNFGTDFWTQAEAVVVDYDIHIISDHGTEGNPNIHILRKLQGVVAVPRGVHVGHRLEPGSPPFGAHARFKGEITMKVVSFQDWIVKALGGFGD